MTIEDNSKRLRKKHINTVQKPIISSILTIYEVNGKHIKRQEEQSAFRKKEKQAITSSY